MNPWHKSPAMTSELIMAKQFKVRSLITFETFALSSSPSLYLQWWVTQQQVLGEPWRVLSFCHLYDKLPRQWTWRAGTLIQFQLLTLGIRLHAFAVLTKGDSPPQKEREKKIIWTQSNKMKGNILYMAEDSSRWTVLIWAQIWFRDSMLQTALYSKRFGSIVFARHSRNREKELRREQGSRKKEGKKEKKHIHFTMGDQQSCSQISVVSN